VIGMRLSDRYAIEERIAIGGMGTVYRALDERLHRRVAVKVLKDHLAHDERFVERFRREARAVASLTHPNIASLYDYGQDGDHHYIVMELVDGTDLATLLSAEGALDPDRAQRIAKQICSALAVAHAAGVVHRDVKPANVLLRSDGTAKVTDFGIARASGDSTLTATGSILGTAHYLAPEQASGEPASPQTDVYATGIVLFEMLTGRVPFDAESPVTVATLHVKDEVPPPSSLRPDVPPHLDEVVCIATSKNPDARYGDAGAMAAALDGARAVPAAAQTSEMGAPVTRTMPLPILGGGGWDAKKVGAVVVGGLVLITVALLAFRLVQDGGNKKRDTRPAAASGDGSASADRKPAPDASTVEVEPIQSVPDVRGLLVPEAAAQLEERGLISSPVGEVEDGIVIGTEPEPGSEVPVGTTVTLLAASEEGDEEDDEKGKGSGPPAHSKGKAKAKEKKDK
jgi:hypothetical protein